MIQVRLGGAWRTITGAQVFANGGWRSLIAVRAYVDGAWRLVGNFSAPSGALSLSLSSTTITGVGATGSTTVTSSNVTVTPSGGTAPYSYLWSIVSSDGQSYTIDAPATVASAAVTGTGLPLDTTNTCTIHCVVTDSIGTTGTSGNVTANLITHSNS